MGKTRRAAQFLAPIFEENQWKWIDSVPNEKAIYEALKDLKESAKEVGGFSSTGRLCARWDHDFKTVEYMLCIPEKE